MPRSKVSNRHLRPNLLSAYRPALLGSVAALLVFSLSAWSYGDDDYTTNPSGIQAGGVNPMYFGNISNNQACYLDQSSGFNEVDAQQAGYGSTFGIEWLIGPGTGFNNDPGDATTLGYNEGVSAVQCWESGAFSGYLGGVTISGDIEDPSWGSPPNETDGQWQANANVISGFIQGVEAQFGSPYTPGIYIGWSEANSILLGWGWNPGYFPIWASGSCGPTTTQAAASPEPVGPGSGLESDFNGLHSDNQAGICRPLGQYVLMWQYIVSSGSQYDMDVDYDLTPYETNGFDGQFPTEY